MPKDVSPPSVRRALDDRVQAFDLRLFLAVLQRGSITAGAQAMSLSLAATSTRLKALEHQVGATLFERSKAGAAATPAGRGLERHAHRVLAELDALHIEMAAFGRGMKGSIRLLCNTAAMTETLPERIAGFLVAHPEIDVELQELSSVDVLDALHRGVADVGIVADHVDPAGLLTQPWIDDELVALLPASTTGLRGARHPQGLRLTQLLRHPFVGLPADAGLSRLLLQQAARSGQIPRHRVRVSTFDAVVRLVGAGVGVAVVPRNAAIARPAADVRVVALQEPWAQRTLLICRTAAADTLPGVRSLIEALLAPRAKGAAPAVRGAGQRNRASSSTSSGNS